MLKYFTFFPVVAALPVAVESWVQQSGQHMIAAVLVIAAAHLALRFRHQAIVRQHCDLPDLEDGEEEFPMKLGLRY